MAWLRIGRAPTLVARAVVYVEGALFGALVCAFFVVGMLNDFNNRATSTEFAEELAMVVGVLGSLWALGFLAVHRPGAIARAAGLARCAAIVSVFFVFLGLQVTMLVLVPSTLYLLGYGLLHRRDARG